jgi:hypothetical protein
MALYQMPFSSLLEEGLTVLVNKSACCAPVDVTIFGKWSKSVLGINGIVSILVLWSLPAGKWGRDNGSILA